MEEAIPLHTLRLYLIGLIVLLTSNGLGLWFIVKGISGGTFLKSHVRIPRLILIVLGSLMQIPIVVYLAFGYFTGILQGIIDRYE